MKWKKHQDVFNQTNQSCSSGRRERVYAVYVLRAGSSPKTTATQYVKFEQNLCWFLLQRHFKRKKIPDAADVLVFWSPRWNTGSAPHTNDTNTRGAAHAAHAPGERRHDTRTQTHTRCGGSSIFECVMCIFVNHIDFGDFLHHVWLLWLLTDGIIEVFMVVFQSQI